MKRLLLVVCLTAVTCPPAFSDEAGSSLGRLLEEVRSARKAGSIANREREERFIEHRDERRRLLDEANRRLEQLSAESESLERRFNANELRLTELETLYRQRAGNFDELSGVFRRAAADLETQFMHSLAALGMQDRLSLLAGMREGKSLPTSEEFDGLLLLFLELMTMQGVNVRFESDVVSPDGDAERLRVVRTGAFTMTAGGDFLSYLPGENGQAGRLFQLARRPAQRYVEAARSYALAEQGFAAAPIDPSRGAVLSLLVRAPTLAERVEQGGIVGYFILLIGLVGLLLGVERLLVLTFLRRAVERQSRDVGRPGDNPLGRVLAVAGAERVATVDYEVLELKLDDAVMKEAPSLERGLGAMKVFAAIAPLLGLLGTVTGMIETFQAITLFGTGDPKLMAGGISQALVTTALGLIVAVPILLLHTLASARSRAIREVLEAQSAGMLAEYAESQTANSPVPGAPAPATR